MSVPIHDADNDDFHDASSANNNASNVSIGHIIF
jgi:hypothetical protein